MEIKICGLTRPKEAAYLNENRVDYAGFVLFFEKSRRSVTIEQAKRIFVELDGKIRRVAVTVSPTAEEVRQIAAAGFDILQVHGELEREALRESVLPVWYACNIGEESQLARAERILEELPEALADRISAIVVDGAGYGSGKTFDWNRSGGLSRRERQAASPSAAGADTGENGQRNPAKLFRGRKFVLAGGLTPENVEEGIRLFSPDIVDVSSGVEGDCGKDASLVSAFVRRAKSPYPRERSYSRGQSYGKQERRGL